MHTFISPDLSLASVLDPAAHLDVRIFSGSRAFQNNINVEGRDPSFDRCIERIRSVELRCEDQCTPLYYFDIWTALRSYQNSLRRIVEVGVYLGGCSSILAEYINDGDLDCTLDLVDWSVPYLLFTYERIRRQCPQVIDRVRLYHGTLPTYVQTVLREEDAGKTFIQHDGSHNFTQVVKDLCSLYYVQDKVTAVGLQDTHLRGMPEFMNFVDMAVYAVFGTEVKYVPVGAIFGAANIAATNPNQYQGNYFRPGVPEGWIIPLKQNTFQYPHPSIPLEKFV